MVAGSIRGCLLGGGGVVQLQTSDFRFDGRFSFNSNECDESIEKI